MIEFFSNLLSLEFWTQLLDVIKSLGIFAGAGLAMLEAFFPPLPLIVFVTVNVMAFGFWRGYFYSWLGSCIGSILVFLLIKRFGQARFQKYTATNERLYNIFSWIKEQGFLLIFLLLTFPFTPSIVVCGLAALAGTSTKKYFAALLLGKLVMIFSLSFIGANVKSFVTQPLKSAILIALTLSISLVGKYIMQRLEKKRIKNKKEQDNRLPEVS